MVLFRRQIEAVPIPPDIDDTITWNSSDIKTIKAATIWESILNHQPQVSWHKILWHKLHVPHYSFILWLGLLRRIPTNDVTLHYSSRMPALCPLCHRRNETFNHLFFLCQYSATVLHDTLRLPMDWAGLTNSIIQFQGRKLSKNILSRSLAAGYLLQNLGSKENENSSKSACN